jgi:hypothetical protein
VSAGEVTVYVPVERARAQQLAAGGPALSAPGYAVTSALREAHGLAADEDEDAGFTALTYAGLAALLHTPGLRLVLAADVAADQVRPAEPDSPFGLVEVSGLRWDQVLALFADDPDAADDLTRAHALAAGRGLDEVADDDRVSDLVDTWDLLWFAPQELAQLG